ncbi:hypothetical protein [Staphylococcus xylosus]|uniref:hypothetical protein n=1 Tax=Staphylococcus xylosus TaxID=1288 RepID=UPI0015D665DB|nr:hypothetical protein [Staphylococcus xylosus]
MKEEKKLPQEELLKIVLKDLNRLLGEISGTFKLLFFLYIAMTVFNSLLLITIISLFL